MEQYPGQWVLVYREQLLATAPTLEEASGHIEKKGLRPDLVTKRYTETREIVWVKMPLPGDAGSRLGGCHVHDDVADGAALNGLVGLHYLVQREARA